MAKIDDSVKKKVPELRFKGFTDDWEQRKLGDEVRIVMGQSPNSENYTDDPNDYILVQGNADMKNGRVLPRVWTTQVTKQAEKDDLILSVRAPVGDIGKTAYDVVIGRGVAAIKGNEFIFQNLGKMKSDGYWTRYSTGSTFESINSTDIKEAIISVPAIEEQDKIGSFFQQLDETIALHQRKLDLLKEQKKGYLQKMFPKNGAKVPELRFAGFADDWEERKFKDNIVSIQTGTNLLGSAVNEGTPLIKMGNLQRGYFSFKKLEYLDSNSNVGSEDIVNYGDFLFNTRNTLELVGKGATWTGISGKYAFNSNIARFKFDGIDTIFFNYLYNTQQVISQVHARAVGTTSVSAVYPRDLNSLLYYLPSLEEQQKIGSFFKQIDKTIALHQRKLDLLKEQKKGFLQKMFV